MTSLRIHATNFIIAATAVAAIGAVLIMPGQSGASPLDEPWPEPAGCSNETLSCTPMEDLIAYECYFDVEGSPGHFCDDPFELLRQDTNRLAIPQPGPDPAPLKLTAPAARR